DPVLHDLVVERLGVGDQVARGSPEGLVRETRRMLFAAEFKRRQAAPVLKVTPKAFGSGWRFPLAQRFGRRRRRAAAEGARRSWRDVENGGEEAAGNRHRLDER